MDETSPENPAESEANPRVNEPLFNVPPLTLGLTAILLAVHAIRLLSPALDEALVTHLVFVPALLTEAPLISSYRLLSYTLLHFGWLHLVMNTGGLLAFGSGIEKIQGKAFWTFLLIGGAIAGVLTHWVIYPQGKTPLGGISAGLSALFGALLPLIARDRRALAKLIVIFVLINFAFGLTGVPDQPDAEIAWQAHLGGFAFGLVAAVTTIKKRTRI